MSQENSTGAASKRRGTTKVGMVVSDVCDQTVTVQVVTPVAHKKYHRIVRQTTRFMAHDKENRCQTGDLVEIRECRPISKRKRWQVVRVVRARRVVGSEAKGANA